MKKFDAVADPTHTWEMSRHVFARDGRRCQYCGTTTARNYVMEHVIPWSIGGHTATYNLVVACQSCNNSKRANVWYPTNIHKLEAENPQWAEQIMNLCEPLPNPQITLTLSPYMGWWFLHTALVQGQTHDAALIEAINDYILKHAVTTADPPDNQEATP